MVQVFLWFFRAQLYATVPLAVVMLLADRVLPHLPPRPKATDGGRGDGLPHLEVLKCAACGAPVPLQPRDPRCPHCRQAITPPADYVETVAKRAQAASTLQTAVRRWQRLRWQSARPVTVALTVVASVWWLATVVGAAAEPTHKNAMMGLGFLLGVVYSVMIFIAAWTLAEARRTMPVVPVLGPAIGQPETTACVLCGAPVSFGAGLLAEACGHCGGENYRVALARAARSGAAADEVAAARSLWDAMNEHEDRMAMVAIPPVVASAVLLLVLAFVVVPRALGLSTDCDRGEIRCGGHCVDPMSDPANCAGCGISCGTGRCSVGTCR